MSKTNDDPLAASSLARHPKPHRLWPDAFLILILTLLPALFFWQLITPNPADQMHIAGGDFTGQYFPLRAFSAQQWVRGQIPLWNPYLYGGQPALADIQSGALYPPHVLQALILGWGGPLIGRQTGFPVQVLEWQVIFHFSLAAVGTYLFGRYMMRTHGVPLRRARFAGVIAALVFTYSGYLTGFPVQQLTILAVSAWLPWILWGLAVATERMGRRTKDQRRRKDELKTRNTQLATRPTDYKSFFLPRAPLRSIALTALAFAMAILAGHPQTVLYIFYLTLAYTAFYALRPTQLKTHYSPLKTVLSHLSLWLFIIVLGTALAAAQLWPTLEFINRSVRADLSYQAVSAGLPLNELVSILYPGFFGGSPQYVGIAPLVLIALALMLAQPRRQIFFWAGAALVSLLLAFGNNLFVYPIFYLLAPGFDAVRQQERVFLIYSFSAAMLAGYGAATLAGPFSKAARPAYIRFSRSLRVVMLVAVALTAFFIYGSTTATARGDDVNLFFGVLRHHIFGLIFLGGMLLLLAGRARRWLRRWWGMGLLALWVAFNLFTVNWRANLAEPDEVPLFTPNGVVQFLQARLQPPAAVGRVSSSGLLPGGNSAASVYNLEDLTGNTPLQLSAVDTFLQQIPAWRLWQLMNVRYIVDRRDISGPGLQPVFTGGDLTVFEMGDPFNRAWLVSQVEVVDSSELALGRLAADDFDLRQSAVVAAPLAGPLAGASDSTATVVGVSPTRLSISVDATGRHLLVASQIYYPGWHVEIDGQPADLLRVNLVQQGVIVPPGQHLVTFTFWPASFAWGLIISGAALLICGLLWGGGK